MRSLFLTAAAVSLLCGVSADREALANQDELRMTRLEFVAFEQEAPRKRNLRLEVGGGVGYPDMDAIDDYVDYIDRTWGGSADHVERYNQYRIGLEYPVAKNWYGGLAYERLEADTSGWVAVTGTRFTIDLEVDGAELYVKKVWPDVISSVDLEGLLGGGYYWSDYLEKENGYRVSGHDEEFGFRAGVGLNWRIANCLDLFIQGSYRWLEFEDYEHSGHPVRFVSPGNPQAEADFSGFNVYGGIVLRF